MDMCDNFRIKIHGYDNFQSISFAYFTEQTLKVSVFLL